MVLVAAQICVGVFISVLEASKRHKAEKCPFLRRIRGSQIQEVQWKPPEMTRLLIYCLACHMPVLKKWDAITILETDCKPYNCCNAVNPTLYCSWLQDHKNKSPKAPSTYSTFNTVTFLTSLEAVLSVLCALVQGFGSMALVLVFVLQLVCGRIVTYLLDVGS